MVRVCFFVVLSAGAVTNRLGVMLDVVTFVVRCLGDAALSTTVSSDCTVGTLLRQHVEENEARYGGRKGEMYSFIARGKPAMILADELAVDVFPDQIVHSSLGGWGGPRQSTYTKLYFKQVLSYEPLTAIEKAGGLKLQRMFIERREVHRRLTLELSKSEAALVIMKHARTAKLGRVTCPLTTEDIEPGDKLRFRDNNFMYCFSRDAFVRWLTQNFVDGRPFSNPLTRKELPWTVRFHIANMADVELDWSMRRALLS